MQVLRLHGSLISVYLPFSVVYLLSLGYNYDGLILVFVLGL